MVLMVLHRPSLTKAAEQVSIQVGSIKWQLLRYVRRIPFPRTVFAELYYVAMTTDFPDVELVVDGTRYLCAHISDEPHASAYEMFRYNSDSESWADVTDYVLVRDYPGYLVAVVHPATGEDRPLRSHLFDDNGGLTYLGPRA